MREVLVNVQKLDLQHWRLTCDSCGTNLVYSRRVLAVDAAWEHAGQHGLARVVVDDSDPIAAFLVDLLEMQRMLASSG